jgi:FkbH-like protein
LYEYDKYDRDRHGDPVRPFEPPPAEWDAAPRRGFLLWGEHCTECAAPACYRSCDLYQPRKDLRCRRFEFGIFATRAFEGRPGAAEVQFKRWAKIEARGNARLFGAGAVSAVERIAARLSPLADRIGAGIGRLTGDARWRHLAHTLLERLNQRLHRSGRKGPVPDAFLAEIYNPGPEPATLLLSMAVDRSKIGSDLLPHQLPPPVFERMTVPPGYFRQRVPSRRFAALLSSGLPFNVAITPAGEGARIVFLTLDFIADGAAAALPATAPEKPKPAAKCVVFDLDNTLWEGILLEGRVALRSGIEETVRRLDERGILISVASKNAEADAMAKLCALGLEDYVLAPQIGWGPKSEGIRKIARSLNIGIDSLVFIDDNPFERDEVRRALPQVEVLPETALPGLLAHPRLQGAVTAESKARRAMYRQSMQREAALVEFGSDYAEFLRSCEIEIVVRPDRPEDFDRICELVQRTNQLNFSGRKYRRGDVQRIFAEGRLERWVIECSDRYGSYGIVGFCLAQPRVAELWIEDLMISCRVQGKSAERALLHALAVRPDWRAAAIGLNFVATDRNAAARAVLADLGFAGEDGILRLRPIPSNLDPDFIRTRAEYPSLERPIAC